MIHWIERQNEWYIGSLQRFQLSWAFLGLAGSVRERVGATASSPHVDLPVPSIHIYPYKVYSSLKLKFIPPI